LAVRSSFWWPEAVRSRNKQGHKLAGRRVALQKKDRQSRRGQTARRAKTESSPAASRACSPPLPSHSPSPRHRHLRAAAARPPAQIPPASRSMDRLRAGSPVYGRQRSGSSTGSSSPGGVSPSHHRSSSTSSAASAAGAPGTSNIRRTQNVAARAAAARLAQVMASQNAAAAAGDDDDDDDYPPPAPGRFGSGRVAHGSNGVSLLGRSARSPSPAVFSFRISCSSPMMLPPRLGNARSGLLCAN
jgi:hypothetical protein